MDLDEGGLGIAEAPGAEVEKMVALIAQPREIAALVAALVRGIHGERLVFLNVFEKSPEIRPQKIAADQIAQRRAPD